MTGSKLDDFLESVHGSGTCQSCHQGAADRTFETMEEAHTGMVRDPSAVGACDGCHADVAAATANSLHTNLWGEKKLIETRGNCTFEGSGYEPFFDQKCAGCHTTCGQCHISRPNSVGGGFPKTVSYLSHSIQRTPHMTEQCTACHGSRVGTDYLGQIEGNSPDTHYSRGMRCEACHTADEIHGDNQHDGDHYEHRYEVKTMPRCEECHSDGSASSYAVDTGSDCGRCHVNGVGSDPVEVPLALVNHAHHIADNSDCAHCHRDGVPATTPSNMQCQVCHSQPYKNCTNCHNLVADEKYDIDPSRIQFKIAHNPRTDYRGEYDYVVVRHVPVDPNSYADWGLVLDQANYVSEPTWKYASPHNILKSTPQTTPPEGETSCSASCHGNAGGVFLTESDLYEDDGVTRLPDYDANTGIVIDGK